MTPRKASAKTYWHLAGKRRVPSEYDIVTSRLHYYPMKGIALALPARDWYEKYQTCSRFQLEEWESFADPRELTYTRYTAQQKEREALVDELLARITETGMDRRLSAPTLVILERALPPLRFALHGLQMVAAYVGHMAPASRITIAALLQTADEMRRIQRHAYRMRQLQDTVADFGARARDTWQRDSAWQPLRRTLETLLVTYDWGEAFTALNLVVKPYLEELFLRHMSEWAAASDQYLWGEVLASLAKDGVWHREWSAALVRHAIAERLENRTVIREWVLAWQPKARDFLLALAPLWEQAAPQLPEAADATCEALLRACGVHPDV